MADLLRFHWGVGIFLTFGSGKDATDATNRTYKGTAGFFADATKNAFRDKRRL